MSVEAPDGVPFVDLRAQHASIAPQLEDAWLAALRRGDFILGQEVEEFEREFAAYCGVAHGIGVDSGTSAIELALRAHGVVPGDEVILPANTFVATALAVTCVGARPVLVDVDPETATIDVGAARAAITKNTAAIVAVHLYGHPSDLDGLERLAARHGLLLIEDACQAHGAEYRGRRVGSFGHAAAFSFYPTKNLGGSGDGGMVVTGDASCADAVRLLRNYGQRVKNRHDVPGYNRRLDTVQAAVLRVKLAMLDRWNEERRRQAADYAGLLVGSGVVTPTALDEVRAVWHLYVVRSGDRDGLRQELARRNISTAIHYPLPIHLQPAYAGLGLPAGSLPVSERLAEEVVSLPLYPGLAWAQRRRVAEAIHAYAGDTDVDRRRPMSTA